MVLNVAIATIIETVAKGDKVTLIGFGSFQPRQRKVHKGRNLKTGEEMTIPVATIPSFSPGKMFKESLQP